jgi:hypothetical protein
MTAVCFDLFHLIFGFDALRDHNFIEAGAETGNRTDDCLGIAFFPETGNKR